MRPRFTQNVRNMNLEQAKPILEDPLSNIHSKKRLRVQVPLATVAGLVLLTLPSGTQAQEGRRYSGSATQPSSANKIVKEITPVQFEKLHALIKPHRGESKFMEIPWVATVGEARKKAAEEGKPLFIWYMVGEPLGQC